MTRFSEHTITPYTIEKFLADQKPKPGRRVIWNSYGQGTYIKSIHESIGSGKHKTVNASI
jgi:hypothetical protein